MTSKARRASAKDKFDGLMNDPPKAAPSKYAGMADEAKKNMSDKSYHYDPSEDRSYRQYKKSYSEAGKKAKDETVRLSKALSGGYSNSYAEKAGELAYADFLKKADDALKDFEQTSYAKNNAEEKNSTDKFNALDNAQKREYERYDDEMKRYFKALDYWAKMAKYLR